MRAKVLAVITSLALCGGLAAGPLSGIAQADYRTAWVNEFHAKIASVNGRTYAYWQCDIGGAVVAAGIYWVWLNPAAAIIGTLAGGAFTAGCGFAGDQQMKGVYYDYTPREMSNYCWEVFPRGQIYRRFTSCIV